MKPTDITGPLKDEGAVTPLPSQVREFIRASKAANTLRGYRSDWREFCKWCEGRSILRLVENVQFLRLEILALTVQKYFGNSFRHTSLPR